MDNLDEILINLIIDINQTAICFDQQNDKEGFIKLDKCIVQITNIIGLIYKYKQKNQLREVDDKRINYILINTFEAMTNRDTILLSDILQYELAEEFQKIRLFAKREANF